MEADAQATKPDDRPYCSIHMAEMDLGSNSPDGSTCDWICWGCIDDNYGKKTTDRIPDEEASKKILDLLFKAISDPIEVKAFLEASEKLLPTVLVNFRKADAALDGIAVIVSNPYAWDDSSSSLESIGNRVEETGRDVWSSHG